MNRQDTVVSEMITVKCGYKGCEWEARSEGESGKGRNDYAYHKLMAILLEHLSKAHRIPPAIWER